MTWQAPEHFGIVVGEERGYSDWGHVISWENYHMPKGTKFYTHEQLMEVRREALEQCAELCELFDDTHPHGLAAEFRKMKELT